MKSTIIITLISLLIFISAFFTVKASFPEQYYHVSSIFILFFAAPAYYFLGKLLGWKKGLFVLLIMSLFAVTLETLAIKTGIPYGRFVYGERIGYKLFDTLPWTMPFAYIPLVIGTVTIAQRISTSKFSVIGISTLLLLLVDLVVDPGAVSMKFWHYHGGGFFYHVPLSNFIGWIISGALGSFLFYSLVEKKELPSKLIYSLFFILVFWTSIAAWNFLVVPLLIGVCLLILLFQLIRQR